MQAHIAWDPGAVEVARHLATSLDAPLVESQLSRLLIDCNRPLDAHDLIPEISETTVVPEITRSIPWNVWHVSIFHIGHSTLLSNT